MKTIDAAIDGIEKCFVSLKEEDQMLLLKRQFAWADWKMQSVFQGDHIEALQKGYCRYPIGWIDFLESDYSLNDFWIDEPFKIVITEWIDEVPMYRFHSVREYVLFFKALYFSKVSIAIDILDKTKAFTMPQLIKLYKSIGLTDDADWNMLEVYFGYKGMKTIQLENKK